jgi:ATP sulfurylase
MNMDLPVKIRPYQESDKPFILNSWLKSNRDNYLVRGVSNTIYYEKHHAVVMNLLAVSNTVVLCDPESPNVVYAYVVFDILPGDILVLHYAYVKQSFRRMHLMRTLVKEILEAEKPIIIFATHDTGHISHDWMRRHDVTYDPYRMFAQLEVRYEDS